MNPDVEPAKAAAADRLFDESSRPEFEVLRRRLLRYYRIKSSAIFIMIAGSLGFGGFFLWLQSPAGGVSPRGILFLVLGSALALLYRRSLDISRRQATQTVVLRKDTVVLRNLAPSRRGDLEIHLESVVRMDLVVLPKVGPCLGMRYRDSGGEKDASHYCHLVIDRPRLRTALSLALPGKVSGRAWDPPEKPPGRAKKLEVSHINR